MKATIRDKRILTTVMVRSLIGRATMERCIAAGWLKPCAQSSAATKPRPVYRLKDVEACEDRIELGEYPAQEGAAK